MSDPPSWRDRLAALPMPSSRLAAAGVAAAVLVAVLVGAVVGTTVLRAPPPPVELDLLRAGPSGAGAPAEDAGPPEQGDVFVHAAGAVNRPGVYQLRPDARVSDLVELAGGPTPDADLNQLNLAAKVGDGERVYVPRVGEAPPTGPSSGGAGGAASGGPPAGPLNLNTATAEQLEELPGVGPATAQAIIEYRKEHGPFRSVDDLLEVRGIGEAKLAALRSKVRV